MFKEIYRIGESLGPKFRVSPSEFSPSKRGVLIQEDEVSESPKFPKFFSIIR